MAALVCTVPIGAAAIAGCGDDDSGESTASEGPRLSAAAEPANVFMRRTAKLLATTTGKGDCAQLEALNRRSYVRFSCPPDPSLRKSMRSFEIVGWKEYGPGAVVDYRSGKVKDGAAILLFVAPDRDWGIARFGVVSEPSTKTGDEDSRDDYEETVASYFDAVRERDCKAWREVTYISPDIKEKDVCGKAFKATEELAARMRANPNAEPVYEGGNQTYGFFSFDTIKPEEGSTISVIKAGESSLVMDVAPGQTARQRKAVADQYRRQQGRGRDQVETSPQRKAD